jgi:nicotinate-nucleotide--dimethylbenzimidazole phosphoribosyltransferase
MPWHSLLILGGITSGHQEYAESLLAELPGISRVAPDGPADPARLAGLLRESKPDQTLLVTGLAAWLPGAGADPAGLAPAIRDCPARLVLVSAEVGLSTTPTTAAGRSLADRLGALNQVVAGAVDAVVLVVAGQPVWLRGSPAAGPAPAVSLAPASPAAAAPDLSRLTSLPVPDEEARLAATEHLARLGAVSLGNLSTVVKFAAGVQRRPVPSPWRRVSALVLLGDHAGAASAGAPGSARRAGQLRAGTGPLAQLSAPVGARVRLVELASAAPIEDGPAMPAEQVEAALEYGWRLAEQAVDEGDELLVLGAIGDGAETAAAAVTAVLAPNSEPAGLLARVRTEWGRIDDVAWMRRCAAVRDAVYRVKARTRTTGRAVLTELGGPDLATATGILLGAAARRTPVLLDGPVGAAAALVARNLAAPSRHWCLLPDHGGHPTVARVAEVLGLTPWLDLRLELGEGATALAALPLLNAALDLAGTIPAPDPPEPAGSLEAEQDRLAGG